MKKKLLFVFYSLLFIQMMPVRVYAYIDPSAATFALQIITGIVITCSVVFGVFFGKIKAFVVSKFGIKLKNKDEETEKAVQRKPKN